MAWSNMSCSRDAIANLRSSFMTSCEFLQPRNGQKNVKVHIFAFISQTVCMCVYLYVCMYVCMYVCRNVDMLVCMYLCMVCMNAWIYVCTHIFMYGCMQCFRQDF